MVGAALVGELIPGSRSSFARHRPSRGARGRQPTPHAGARGRHAAGGAMMPGAGPSTPSGRRKKDPRRDATGAASTDPDGWLTTRDPADPACLLDRVSLARRSSAVEEHGRAARDEVSAAMGRRSCHQGTGVEIAETPRRPAADQDVGASGPGAERDPMGRRVADACCGSAHPFRGQLISTRAPLSTSLPAAFSSMLEAASIEISGALISPRRRRRRLHHPSSGRAAV